VALLVLVVADKEVQMVAAAAAVAGMAVAVEKQQPEVVVQAIFHIRETQILQLLPV
jgi:hypothetical protein